VGGRVTGRHDPEICAWLETEAGRATLAEIDRSGVVPKLKTPARAGDSALRGGGWSVTPDAPPARFHRVGGAAHQPGHRGPRRVDNLYHWRASARKGSS
jgi:hypothetical protein